MEENTFNTLRIGIKPDKFGHKPETEDCKKVIWDFWFSSDLKKWSKGFTRKKSCKKVSKKLKNYS